LNLIFFLEDKENSKQVVEEGEYEDPSFSSPYPKSFAFSCRERLYNCLSLLEQDIGSYNVSKLKSEMEVFSLNLYL
jgi:hypothetical protein